MYKRTLITLAQYALGVGLLGWVIASYWQIDIDGEAVGIQAALARPIHLLPLLGAGLLCTLGVFLNFVRWFILVRAQDLPFTLRDCMRLGLIGFFFNTFLPGAVGGDLIKAAFVAREQRRRTVAIATIVVDRVVGLCGLLCLAAVTGAIFLWTGALAQAAATDAGQATLRTILSVAAGLVALALVSWILLGLVTEGAGRRWAERLEGIPRVGGPVAELWRAMLMYRNRSASVGIALLLAIVTHAGFVLAFYCAASALTPADDIPSLTAHFLIVPTGKTIEAGVPTPAGVGGGEFGFGKLYELLGAAFAYGVLGSLVYRSWTWILGFCGYMMYFRLRRRSPDRIVQEPINQQNDDACTSSFDGP